MPLTHECMSWVVGKGTVHAAQQAPSPLLPLPPHLPPSATHACSLNGAGGCARSCARPGSPLALLAHGLLPLVRPAPAPAACQAREAAKLNEKRRQALIALDIREVDRDSLKYERVCWEKLR